MTEEGETSLIVIGVTTVVVLIGHAIYRVARANREKLIVGFRRLIEKSRLLVEGRDASVRDWDGAEMLRRVPLSTVGFLLIEYFILWITIALGAGETYMLRLREFFQLWETFIGGLATLPGILGVGGVVIGTVYGLHQDLVSTRYKVLGAIGIAGLLIGVGIRFD